MHAFVIETFLHFFILIGLPLCVNTEDATQLSVRASVYLTTMIPTEPDHSLTSSAGIHKAIYTITYISLTLQFLNFKVLL